MNSPVIAELFARGGDRLPVIVVAVLAVIGLGFGVLGSA